jgi:Domain of unknown function (DUF4157)
VTRAVLTLLAVVSAASCSSLSKDLQKKNRFRLVEDDGRNSVWSVRPVGLEAGRDWLRLVVAERKRVEDFFATAVTGRIILWLVDELPRSFEGDAFSEGSEIYLRMGASDRPSENDGNLVTHEMTHVVMVSAFGMKRPFWFEEGLATYLEGQRHGFGAGGRDLLSGVTGLDALDPAALSLETVGKVEKPLAYRLSAGAIELILEKHGGAAIRRLQREPSGRPFSDGYFRVTGETLAALETRWRDEIRAAARPQSLRR